MNKSISRWLLDHPAVYALYLPIIMVIVRMADWYTYRSDPGDKPTPIFYGSLPFLWLFAYLLSRFRVGRRSSH